MSRIDDLIKKLCPNGVVYEEIGAVVEIKNGKDWKTERPGKFPFLEAVAKWTFMFKMLLV